MPAPVTTLPRSSRVLEREQLRTLLESLSAGVPVDDDDLDYVLEHADVLDGDVNNASELRVTVASNRGGAS